MPRHITIGLTAAVLVIAAPGMASAYIGPGAGLSAIGTILALVGAIVIAAIGFLWYPIKRILRYRKNQLAERTKAAADKKPEDS